MEKLIKETQEKYARAFIRFREENGEIRPVSLSNKVHTSIQGAIEENMAFFMR